MRPAAPILAAAVIFALLGCSRNTTKQKPVELGSKAPKVVDITESLRRVPVPVPLTTPYDDDPEKKEAYVNGFRDGWEKGITGMLKYACEHREVLFTKDDHATPSLRWMKPNVEGSLRTGEVYTWL